MSLVENIISSIENNKNVCFKLQISNDKNDIFMYNIEKCNDQNFNITQIRNKSVTNTISKKENVLKLITDMSYVYRIVP
jgi:hypothetical protein